MSRFLKFLAIAFATCYLLALCLLAVSTLGLFGTEPDPLAVIFLLPLGMPWVLLVDLVSEELWPWLTALAPALNLAILLGLWKYSASRQIDAPN
ncbi:hypothetical protein [Allorhodopirellula heiligendammensis]|uniref:Uncharacterized protein n=1 Tax=Allorhodopirellula heiligendammensis TaxID=2714739 RepID=A0A5C6BCT5_9BACT|nr:hypothetical protein [Allorhodopirellula heiligendammensis]TWU10035.1 hypothetical protein Poly21_53680 [Allorhodopirellula heiligendammensis]